VRALLASLLVLAACGDDAGTTATSGSGGGSGGSSSDGGGSPAGSGGSGGGGGTPASSSASGSSGAAGGGSSASGTSGSSAVTATASTASGGDDEATIDIQFGGSCAPDFSGDLVVAANADSVAVTSVEGTFSSIQFDLHQSSGSIDLSTAQRVRTGDVINLTIATTWTNISSDAVDPIAGTLVINDYQEQAGILDLAFQGVVLQNPSDGTLCTLDGTLVATGTSF
jgi:hypothetical protein